MIRGFEEIAEGNPPKVLYEIWVWSIRKGEGIQHIAFDVDDLDREVAKLTKQGVSVLLSASLRDVRVAYLDLGVGGLIFELIQRK